MKGNAITPLARVGEIVIKRPTTVADAAIEQLADVLVDCVSGGASVSFMLPLPRERAIQFWRRVADDVARGKRALLVAEDAAGICGTVQLLLDLPENQPHRADVAKMLVHRRARRLGLGEALMTTVERLARDCGRTLLVLDTVTVAMPSGCTCDWAGNGLARSPTMRCCHRGA